MSAAPAAPVAPVASRPLPPAGPASWELRADVLIVGSGAAGIAAALAAAQAGRDVLLISKDDVGGGATPLAQGGLAAALGPGDHPAVHQSDTLAAGAGLCDLDAVATLVNEAPAEIARLAGLGARLNTRALHREGGHRLSRIVHAGGDAIGAEVHRVLSAALRSSPVRVLTRCVALDALTGEGGAVGGVLAGIIDPDGTLRPGTITARAVVLATGGFGQAYATTSSPAGVTGDGLALAARAGAAVQDVEFVQFHPTVLWQPGAQGQSPLITEALRGAGAVLIDQAGHPVMAGRHPLGDLAPRDVVSAAMQEALEDGTDAGTGGSHLWLDATGLGREVLERNFPTVLGLCRARGIDPVTAPIPVAPGAHYTCGGVRAGMTGRTSLPGLLAVGEVASTGVHGANRLASNSVTEALITGRRAGERLGAELPAAAGPLRPPAAAPGPEPAGPGVDPAVRAPLALAMSRYAGVLRDRDGLEHLLGRLDQAPPAASRSASAPLDLATVEATNLHLASVLLTVAALARTESRGCHRWHASDAIDTTGNARHSVLRLDPELTVSARPVLTDQGAA
jgi:L-aspartate oxidase